MNFVEYLSNEATSTITNFHLFLLNIGKEELAVHAFFEGKTDESFYATHILKEKPTDYVYFSYYCGNKDKVYEAYTEIIKRKNNKHIVLFFVDKDLDDIVPVKRKKSKFIFTTEYYSIENYIVNNEVLERIWAEIFKLKSGTSTSKNVATKFSLCYEKFCGYFIDIMVWILFHRRNQTELCLSKLKLMNIFEVDDELDFIEKIPKANLIRECDKMCNVTTPSSFESTKKNLITQLTRRESKNYIRGKFEICFFVIFLNKLIECLKKAFESKNKKFVTRLPIHQENAIDILAPRLDCPVKLKSFLHVHFK